MPRPLWKGSLKLSLVSVPVRMFSAENNAESVSFHRYHAKCGGRVRSKNWCPAPCAREIPNEEIQRGFEYAKGEHIVITDEELDTCESEVSTVLDVTTIVKDQAIDPAHIDTTAWLLPDGAAALQPFETVRQALGNRLAVGSMVIRKRTVLVALQAAPKAGFTAFLLRAHSQVRQLDDLELPATVIPPKQDLVLARQLLDNLVGSFSYADVRDEWTERVRELIQAKVSGAAIAPKVVVAAAKVTSLTEALQQSLALAAKGSSKPVVATPAAVLPVKGKAVKVTEPRRPKAAKKAAR